MKKVFVVLMFMALMSSCAFAAGPEVITLLDVETS